MTVHGYQYPKAIAAYLQGNRHRFLSLIRKRGMLIVSQRTVTQSICKQLSAEGSQMKETRHGREDSYRDKLVIAGKLCYYRHVWLQELHEYEIKYEYDFRISNH